MNFRLKLSFFSVCFSSIALLLTTSACSTENNDSREEHIRIEHSDSEESGKDTSQVNSIQGNLSLTQIPSTPSTVVLTGLASHRLVTVYKKRNEKASKDSDSRSSYDYYSYRSYEPEESERVQHFMPGIDLIHGYNLLNVAHYDLTTEKLNFLFRNPVLIKSLYYPSFEQDSLHKKPIHRDYYLISVYDEDTNRDTLINKTDLRRFYYFNSNCTKKIQLVPSDYSVVRSQYDSANDVMYVFARHDENENGILEKKEPLHIFWFSLKLPAEAKRLY